MTFSLQTDTFLAAVSCVKLVLVLHWIATLVLVLLWNATLSNPVLHYNDKRQEQHLLSRVKSLSLLLILGFHPVLTYPCLYLLHNGRRYFIYFDYI